MVFVNMKFIKYGISRRRDSLSTDGEDAVATTDYRLPKRKE